MTGLFLALALCTQSAPVEGVIASVDRRSFLVRCGPGLASHYFHWRDRRQVRFLVRGWSIPAPEGAFSPGVRARVAAVLDFDDPYGDGLVTRVELGEPPDPDVVFVFLVESWVAELAVRGPGRLMAGTLPAEFSSQLGGLSSGSYAARCEASGWLTARYRSLPSGPSWAASWARTLAWGLTNPDPEVRHRCELVLAGAF